MSPGIDTNTADGAPGDGRGSVSTPPGGGSVSAAPGAGSVSAAPGSGRGSDSTASREVPARPLGLVPARLTTGDLGRVASVGLRTRRLRAALSALGIAIGVAAIVAVLGLSSSSQAGLLSEIDRLGTNLLTVTNGQTFTGQTAQLPLSAPAMIGRIGPVRRLAETGAISSANAFRSPLIPGVDTNAITVDAASLNLLPVIATTVAQGSYLNAATATEPVAVLGAAAAQRMGVDRVYPGERIWVGGQWFYVAGILNPSVLTPEIDSSVLVGFAAAERYLDYASVVNGSQTVGPPTTIYVRAQTSQVPAVQSVLAQTANPENPNEVDVSLPSAALIARADAQSALNGLFLGLGAVALLVGAVGVANIMIISVLERRSEIGLRRALGATRGQIRLQFLSEAIMLALLGGAGGLAAGVVATIVYASTKSWSVVIPPLAWGGGLGAAMAIGAIAGLLPAIRAARLSPTEALRTV
jgi:putative ABC transport system permease protein